MALHISPDTVDVVTELSSIITGLRGITSLQQSSSPHGPGGGNTAAGPSAQQGGTGVTPLPTTAPTPSNPSNNHDNPSQLPQQQHQPQLSIKDLPIATDNLKHKLQRARAAVRAVGDVSGAIARQEAEVKRLEARRAAQARMLARTQEDGLTFVRRGAGDGEGPGKAADGGGNGVDKMVE
ncbi:uncharacterized protein C8A04DRAFT_33074 [Dichotomopilus funicola]|uniref:Mediator of RNA polymerase II transcription subunit 9 n=1 Tax=Dichotomopilus funicola TaxID=1934379 RepID=A0AAN6UUY1_9PEZI|nr:hypothetical protein C8A04DRAFT_33074 [Dichotomopilus funicola]